MERADYGGSGDLSLAVARFVRDITEATKPVKSDAAVIERQRAKLAEIDAKLKNGAVK